MTSRNLTRLYKERYVDVRGVTLVPPCYKHLTSRLLCPIFSLITEGRKKHASIRNFMRKWVSLCHTNFFFFVFCPDSSCISHRWNSEDSTNPTGWDASRNELLSWDNMERCAEILAPCWHCLEESRNRWACPLQCPSHSILFVDGWRSWWYAYFFKLC